MSYNIKLEQFEGPLDLLLQLTEQQKLDITRVSLAQIADQYLEYIAQAKNVTLAHLADFLSVASRLILIKSKALLPMLEFTEEEEEEIKDLEHQLAEYKKFKDASKNVVVMFDSSQICFSREGFSGFGKVFYPPEKIVSEDLLKAFNKVLGEIPVVEKLEEEMVKEILTLEDKIVHLQNTLKERAQTSFSELVANAKDKVEIVVSFLAMLELVKQRIIYVEQGELFSEIHLKHKDNKSIT
ncbi:MAG: Segregation and condensation protein A [Candidatus Moranbacteria bacterium GW2011_GWE1_36_7]|nr:MAG: Segregation and condensation protein A [Candidatus Moranbacteria bacterium GW2011_GWD2_36_12]KKQ06213.1 MAG: Segregation and condensation protein A [Candidatus Moranbacteria bacterium GW2011_GWE2_36_40]KKQ14155.1 MAG: Segregation and condensation protein A [Candidatus Moranbacteria bacterium GW2011_GWE1_36_7]